MPTVKVTSRVEHDGEVYEAGDSVEVTAAQKRALVEAGVVDTSSTTRADSAQEGEVVKTKKELVEEAHAEGLVLEGVDGKSTKAQIEEAITAARAARDQA